MGDQKPVRPTFKQFLFGGRQGDSKNRILTTREILGPYIFTAF